MKRYKDIGIIFKQYNINEADRIIHILTKFHGRVECIAKGVRKMTSRKAGSLDIADLSKFYLAVGRNLDIITDVKLIKDFSTLKKELDSTFLILYICELIDNFTLSGEDERHLFELTHNLFLELENEINNLLIRSFEIKILEMKGYEPNLKSCSNCDKSFSPGTNIFLSNTSPGFYCDCRKSSSKTSISMKALKTLKYLKNNTLNKAHKIKKDTALEKELKLITKTWLENILEKELKSSRFLDK